jgi:anti-anti-sigma factor
LSPELANSPRSRGAAVALAAVNFPSRKVPRVDGFTEIGSPNSEQFRERVIAALDGHAPLGINLSRTTFMDGYGLGALITLRKHARRRGCALRLVNPAPDVRRLLTIVEADPAFETVNAVGLHPIAADLAVG